MRLGSSGLRRPGRRGRESAGVNELVGLGDIPLLVRRGGRDIKKNGAKPLHLERTGWSLTSHVAGFISRTCPVSDHPVCAASVASRLFLTGAATPPHEEGIIRLIQTLHQFVHSFIDRAYSRR